LTVLYTQFYSYLLSLRTGAVLESFSLNLKAWARRPQCTLRLQWRILSQATARRNI